MVWLVSFSVSYKMVQSIDTSDRGLYIHFHGPRNSTNTSEWISDSNQYESTSPAKLNEASYLRRWLKCWYIRSFLHSRCCQNRKVGRPLHPRHLVHERDNLLVVFLLTHNPHVHIFHHLQNFDLRHNCIDLVLLNHQLHPLHSHLLYLVIYVTILFSTGQLAFATACSYSNAFSLLSLATTRLWPGGCVVGLDVTSLLSLWRRHDKITCMSHAPTTMLLGSNWQQTLDCHSWWWADPKRFEEKSMTKNRVVLWSRIGCNK